jgi:2-desacetyl-2-hydroxyethyl bacteriochlorophyllide A dehydrogenase
MKALCYNGPADIRFEDASDPQLRDSRQALVQMEQCAICGSDLHIYHGRGFSEDLGFCVGHEAVGEVVEVGKDCRRLKPGDKVMISAAVGCGDCAPCLAGLVVGCEKGPPGCFGLSHALEGCQAEAIVVPAADFNAAPIPDGLTNEQALLLTDNLPTAYMGCLNADVGPGRSVAVVGLGPIGLMAVECAFVLGASRVFAIDLVESRRQRAAELGAIPIAADDAVEQVRELTGGRMVTSAIEAVGLDQTISLAIRLTGQLGTISAFGVNLNQNFNYPLGTAFMNGLTFRISGCSIQQHWPALIPLVRDGRLSPEKFISHRMPLSEGAEAYRIFDATEDVALKMILQA